MMKPRTCGREDEPDVSENANNSNENPASSAQRNAERLRDFDPRWADRFVVLGAGRSGLAAARLLASLGKFVTVCDDGNRSDDEAVQALAEGGADFIWANRTGAEVALGCAEALVVSPGVPAGHSLIASAEARGLPIVGELELAWRFSGDARIVAVTGTNGKTTVTMLIRHLLEAAGLPAVETGNIGHPFSDAVREAAADPKPPILVVEVSSFQLEWVARFAPDVAVLLNITPDHLDRHGSMKEYAEAKRRIAQFQRADQTLVVNQDDAACLAATQDARARLVFFSLDRPVDLGAWVDDDRLAIAAEGSKPHGLIELDELPLFGMHNAANALAAACAASALGVGRKTIARALKTFQAAPHRLESVATVGGVEFVNDSKATNLDALVKAVESFNAPVHLIAGGRDKDSPFASVRSRLEGRVACAYLIGEASDRIAQAWDGAVKIAPCETMDKALEAARVAACAGEVVLLAPGCASFDQFANYAERGEAFARWVRELQARTPQTKHETAESARP